MNRVKDNRDTEYVVEPQQPELRIEGYGLLYEGRPLLVEDESVEHGGYYDHYVLNTKQGMPYLVDLHTMRYYLATYKLQGSRWSEQYRPEDCYNLVEKATPCHMKVSVEVRPAYMMQVGNSFALSVSTRPLIVPIEPYKVVPYGCLDNTESGPMPGTILKVLRYTPDNLGGTYVGDDGLTLDTYIGPADTTPGLQARYGGRDFHYHIFKREDAYPEFYETFEMGSILTLQRGMK